MIPKVITFTNCLIGFLNGNFWKRFQREIEIWKKEFEKKKEREIWAEDAQIIENK